MNITFNPQLASISYATYQNTTNQKEQQNIQRNTMTELPSFGARKPLTEEQKCLKLLKETRNPDGHSRYKNKEEIENIMDAIKNFKTETSKSKILTSLLYYQTNNLDYFNDLSTENIIDYFNYMSGKNTEAQIHIAEDLSSDIPSSINQKLNLLKNGNIKNEDFEYIFANINGTDAETRGFQFARIFALIARNPKLTKHIDKLIEKANINNDAREIMFSIDDSLGKQKTSSILKLLSFITAKKAADFTNLLGTLRYKNPKKIEKIISGLNRNNFDYMCIASEREDFPEMITDIENIQKYSKPLPSKKLFKNNDEYFMYVKRLITSSQK